jgi:hypothetical protein
MPKTLHLNELLNFYDYRVSSSFGHASAVNAVLGEDLAVALLTHYFKGVGLEVVALDEVCTQGTQRGNRLDKWIAVNSATESVIYQVEIKNWSAHSIGGKSVMVGADEDYMREFRRKRWVYQFNEEEQIPSQPETLKVLTKMRIPSEYINYKHEAMLCFWEPLHPQGELEALFEVDVVSDEFKKLKVFSMSNYVSELLKTTDKIVVGMNDADERIEWLQKIYS